MSVGQFSPTLSAKIEPRIFDGCYLIKIVMLHPMRHNKNLTMKHSFTELTIHILNKSQVSSFSSLNCSSTGYIDCWAANMKLHYDPDTHETSATHGAEFRVPGFGETYSVEYVDDSWMAYMMYNIGGYFFNTMTREYGEPMLLSSCG